MPIPKPKEKEKKEVYLSRCMASSVMRKEYPEIKKRFAICKTEWDKKIKK